MFANCDCIINADDPAPPPTSVPVLINSSGLCDGANNGVIGVCVAGLAGLPPTLSALPRVFDFGAAELIAAVSSA